MVSLTAALMLTVSVFVISKQTTSLYQRENRVAAAQVGAVIGFERLRADISRAGYMASPHALRDPFICGTPLTDATWPIGLRNMASLAIENEVPVPTVANANGLAPQRITLAGNFTSAEALPIRSVVTQGGNNLVYLQVQSGPLSRLGFSAVGANQQAILAAAFPVGRAVRIVDKAGRHHYGTLRAVQASPVPMLTLAGNSPVLQFRSGSAIGCGLRGEETGAMINTVNFIRYRIGSLAGDSRYAALYPSTPVLDYDSNRTELVREELDVAGAPLPGTSELVAEFAFDLRFRATVASAPTNPLAYVDQAALSDWAGPASQIGAGRGPQLVRSVHTWLSVRSREADRAATIPVANGPLHRLDLGGGGPTPFARVRTLQARIALPNQLGVTWQ